MPQAILIPAITYAAPALIGAGAAYGVAAKQAGAQKRAAAAQKQSTDQALEFERQKYADSQAREAKVWGDYERRRAEYDAGRRAILAKYGINTGTGGGSGAGGVNAPPSDTRTWNIQRADGSSTPGAPSAEGVAAPPMAPMAGGGGGGQNMTGGQGTGLEALGLDSEMTDPGLFDGSELPKSEDWADWGNYGVR